MNEQTFLLIAAALVLVGPLVALSRQRPRARSNALPVPRWRCIRIHPARLDTGGKPFAEEPGGSFRLFRSGVADHWSGGIHLVDRWDRPRVRIKPVIFSRGHAVKVYVDSRHQNTVRLRGDEIHVEPPPAGASRSGGGDGNVVITGTPTAREWELRLGSRTVASAYPPPPEGAGKGGGDATGATGPAVESYNVDILRDLDPLPMVAIAAGIEVVLASRDRTARPAAGK